MTKLLLENAAVACSYVYAQPNATEIMLAYTWHEQVPLTREVLAYTWAEFFGDVGGLTGLFLGVSLWGIFLTTKGGVDKLRLAIRTRTAGAHNGLQKNVVLT